VTGDVRYYMYVSPEYKGRNECEFVHGYIVEVLLHYQNALVHIESPENIDGYH
jgi:hypothetical protein